MVTKNGRDYFTVTEGVHKGKPFSAKSGNLARTGTSHKSSVHLIFNQSKNLLKYPGGEIATVTSLEKPTPIGVHPIQIPDFPHEGGMHYLASSRYAKTWFFVGHGNASLGRDRYLHTGRASLGCITVDPSGWTKLYEYLICCRNNDAKTIGSVSVVR
jgi:hypothetical protein